MASPSELTDCEAAIDAVLRFVKSLDNADPSLLYSAFTSNATVDLSPICKIGLAFFELNDRDTIVSKVLKSVDSTHHVSNSRVTLAGDSAA